MKTPARHLIWPLLLAAVAMRLAFPCADPPFEYGPLNYTITGELFTFEGNAWSQDARNKALFGEWVMDKWPTSLLMPLHNLASYLSFSLFGVGLWQVRLPSMVFGVLTTVLLFAVMRRSEDDRTGLMTAFLWGVNYLAVALNKTALIESGLIFTTVAAFACWHLGRKTAVGHLLFGVAAVLCVLYKPTGLIIPATGVCVYLSGILRDRGWRNAAWFAAGVGLTGLLYLALFHSRLAEIFTFYKLIGNSWRPKTTIDVIMSGGTFMVSRYFFIRQPLLFITALLWLGWCLSRLAADPDGPGSPASQALPSGNACVQAIRRLGRVLGRLDPADLYLALWFLFGLAMPLVEGGQNPMLRRYMFLLPPMAVMGAKLLNAVLAPGAGPAIHPRMSRAVLFLVGYVACFSLLRMVFFPDLAAFRGAHVRPFFLVFLTAVLAGLLCGRLDGVARRLLGRLAMRKTAFVAGLLCLYGLFQAGQVTAWAAGRHYTIYESNRRLAAIDALQSPVIMAGNTLTITASFLSGYRTLVVGSPPAYMNWRQILESPQIEYYLLNRAPYMEDNPIMMPFLTRYPNAVPVAEVIVGRRKATIYRKVATAP
ncbi:MAG: glycosyltransferase family 39 protein [Pseudomonadota bacterium]